ncbi:MAG: YjcZ family sporulation protein [Anaerobacillus sp.]
MGAGHVGYAGAGFALILVLFILLVIIGTAYVGY